VDYQTQRRIPKASFHWYAQLIKAATVKPEFAEAQKLQRAPQVT
jgi:hypothetical protein